MAKPKSDAKADAPKRRNKAAPVQDPAPSEADPAVSAAPEETSGKPSGKKGIGRPKGVKERRPRKRKHPKLVEARLRAQEACQYRTMGYTYAQIAEFCGYNSPQAAEKAVKSVLDQVTRERGDDLLRLIHERLEMLTQGAMNAAMSGDNFAAETVLKVIDRYDRLYGLSKPIKVAPTTPDGESPAPTGPTLDWMQLFGLAKAAENQTSAPNGGDNTAGQQTADHAAAGG